MIEQITADRMQADYLLALYRRGMVTVHADPKPSARILAERYAAAHGIPKAAFFGPTRTRDVAWPRQDCMAMLRRRTKLSTTAIGKIFGRDHSTVLHAIEASEQRQRKGN